MRYNSHFRMILAAIFLSVATFFTGCLQPKPSYLPHNSGRPQSYTPRYTENGGDEGVLDASATKIENFSGGGYALNSSIVARNLATVLLPFLDTPYKYGGESIKGVDCSGLVRKVYMDGFNIELPHKASYQYALGQNIGKKLLLAGDLVFFYETEDRSIGHVGIYLGEGRFIHSMAKRGVVISHLQEDYWKKYYAGARRIFGKIKPTRPIPEN
ncbi:MAG: C40 family peptidase [Deferribacteres bacterium]|nr:C40 family peptidase [candidate division KSB1 bacterium]MCB9501727.1 C40 family peptidase [Deferribacteres bacterium]